MSRVWIDVGACVGRKSLRAAIGDPHLTVYAFEPNISMLSRIDSIPPNWIPMPMAVCASNGFAKLYVTNPPECSSLLPLDQEGLEQWGGKITVEREILVPTIRLDYFISEMGIREVEYLKIDAQGLDLAVVQSLATRITQVKRICLEIQVDGSPYQGNRTTLEQVSRHMKYFDFKLVNKEPQTDGKELNLEYINTR